MGNSTEMLIADTTTAELEELHEPNLDADLISELADAFEDVPDGEVFDSLDDLFRLEEAETEGRWVHWPDLPPGNEVKIAHITAAEAERERLERVFRAQRGRPIGKALGKNERQTQRIEAELWIRSLFGSVVRDWRGPQMPEFNVTEFLQLFGTADRRTPGLRRFRAFILRHAREMEDLRTESLEGARGNLSAV